MKKTLLVLLVLTGCASTTVFPREDGSFALVANSYSQDSAIAAARDDADEHCKRLGRTLVVVHHETRYNGADKNAKAVIGAVGVFTGRYYGDGSRMDDYTVDLQFKCR